MRLAYGREMRRFGCEGACLFACFVSRSRFTCEHAGQS